MCRSALGIAEAAGIPAAGKAGGMYLKPQELALGAAFSQLGLTLGMVTAPLLTAFFSSRYGWRSAFVVAGALGLIWIPVWLLVQRHAPVLQPETKSVQTSITALIGDGRWWWLMLANSLAMVVYSLWTGWTTYFLVTRYHLQQNFANSHFAWIPPIFAALGGLAGGWLAMYFMRRGVTVVTARLRLVTLASCGVLLTALAPQMPSPEWAVLIICLSYFFSLMSSVNTYSLPVDLFGAKRSALSVAGLVTAYGLMQTIVSPYIGRWSDTIGWQPVCALAAGLPLVGAGILQLTIRRK
jgi:ACS family hexuronate transporter-like MFS transporter